MVQLFKKEVRGRDLLVTMLKCFCPDPADILAGTSGYSKEPFPISG